MQLSKYDPEDINDVIKALESSFGVHLDQYDLAEVKTFGDLCDVFENAIQKETREDCTTQQAFYKLRTAISESLGIAKETIKPESLLTVLFPRKNRRKHIRLLENQLGIKLNILNCAGWLSLLLFVGFITSFITLFFNWKMGLSGLLLCYLGIWIADKTAKELEVQTVRELTEKVAAFHYQEMRRISDTVNRKEIVASIKEVFSKYLGIDSIELTSEARFFQKPVYK